jgi:hypothetical protein
MTCFVTGSMVLYRITPQSGTDYELVSVVKILLKAFLPFNGYGRILLEINTIK